MHETFVQLRQDFPMLQRRLNGHPLVYLDSAATTLKPNAVIDAISKFYREQYGTVHRAVYGLAVEATAQIHRVRRQLATFLNAERDEEIIFTRGTTESINLVATAFGKAFIQQGDEIVISQLEHHSNIVPWQMMCAERGAVLKIIPADENGQLCLDAYEQLLNSRTKIVSVAHVANSTGVIHPVREIVRIAHNAGAKVLIDGAQAAPHMPVDVQGLDADFYVFSGHKLYGPTGIGVLYGRQSLLEQMPPYQGGGDMIDTVTFEKTTYNALPFKFEAGTPAIAEIIGLGAAVNYINTVGLSNIQKWEHNLLEYAREALTSIPKVRIIGTAVNQSGIISFVVENVHPLDLGTLLNQQGVAIRTGHHCAQPAMKHLGVDSTARISFGLYNTFADIDRCVEVLQHSLTMLS